MKIQWKTLIGNLIIPLAVGAIAGFFTRNAMDSYQELRQPPLAPPSVLFPIVWTTLFILMGISAYLVSVCGDGGRYTLPKLYWVQLIVNFLWPFIFFQPRNVSCGIPLAYSSDSSGNRDDCKVLSDFPCGCLSSDPVSSLARIRRLSEPRHPAAQLSISTHIPAAYTGRRPKHSGGISGMHENKAETASPPASRAYGIFS